MIVFCMFRLGAVLSFLCDVVCWFMCVGVWLVVVVCLSIALVCFVCDVMLCCLVCCWCVCSVCGVLCCWLLFHWFVVRVCFVVVVLFSCLLFVMV